ncbi:MAG: FAD binding domain-containing protein [Betaproteobacteria bacterium]
MPEYLRPARIDAALTSLAGGRFTILAGGTDYYAARVGKPLDDAILDITAIRGLRGIDTRSDHWRIGAGASWTDVLEATLPPLFDGLKLAAREIGGVQVQNSGTLAGNLCNASPAADGVPVLLALNASVELASTRGVRVLPLGEFILGPRKTARRGDEMLTAILVPKPAHAASSHFLKLGARKYLLISIVMAGVVLEHEGGIVRKARIAVGSCSPVALRLTTLEDALIGQPMGARLAAIATEAHLAPLAPIDDVRASAGYRVDSALTVVRRTIAGACA